MKPLSQVLLLGNGFQRLMDGFSAGLPEEQNLYLDINLPLRDRHACLGRTKPSKLLSEGSWPSPEPLEAAMAGARVMTCEIQPYSSSPARLHRRRRLRPRSQPAADLSWCRRLCIQFDFVTSASQQRQIPPYSCPVGVKETALRESSCFNNSSHSLSSDSKHGDAFGMAGGGVEVDYCTEL
ncbi:hypothetical protein FQA47_016031 [Oryzias melastigma]|uniref:Uncharacterized protein n=1 Tax=Oryzias melastigma TaxID=30732 RepID=A0A834FNX7_ORYME|nr:hypothetical protein FQA47_016031 [Oryzias melastigma]